MKQIFYVFAVLTSAFMFSSCKEHANLGVVLTDAGQALKDTTYTAAIEAVSPKKVVVEEFTGASCPNCPDARTMLAGIAAANPNRIITMELHPKEVPQGRPIMGESKYDFTNSFVSDIIAQFYPGLGAIPIGGIDRIPDNGNRLIDRSKWASIINSRLATASVANLKLTNTYDDAKREGVIKVKVAYTGTVTNKQYITLAILESDIEDVQEYPDHNDHNYIFKHVFRGTATPVSGAVILDSIATKAAGRVYEGSFKYKIADDWKPENCHAVVFLHNNDASSKEILQAEEIEVK